MPKLQHLAAILLWLGLVPQPALAAAVDEPAAIGRTITSPGPGRHELITLEGPSVFVSASVTKQGGVDDMTVIELSLDDRSLVNISMAAARRIGLRRDNPYGVALLAGAHEVQTLTIGFNAPLRFERELVLRAGVAEAGVAQLTAVVVHGKDVTPGQR